MVESEDRLIQSIKKYVNINEEEICFINSSFEMINLKNKNYLLHEGQICNSLYFVEQGCLRMYYITNKATEQIVQFALEEWWLADYRSFMENSPSNYYIQAIEKTIIQRIEKQKFDKLLTAIPQLERYFRIIMQKSVAAAQHRTKLQFEMSKEEFFQHFTDSFPEFIQRVPQYRIASYLVLTPEYVSEIRKKKK